MQGPDFIFAIQDKHFNFWKIDDNGVVSKTAQAYFLQFSPSGWENMAIQNVRNKRYWAIDRNVTIPLQYVNDGAKILKHVFYTLGIEESIYLSVSMQQLVLNKNPTAIFTVLTGGNPLTAGTNTGTVTDVPGATVYLKLEIAGIYVDNIFGNIGTSSVYLNGTNGSNIFPVIVPASGIINYNLVFANTSSTATGKITIVNSAGSSSANYGYWYKQFYRAEIDLSTFKHDGPKVSCNTLEDGLAKFLKANENTVYEFPVNIPEAVTILSDGINLHNKVDNLVSEGPDPSDPNYDTGRHIVALDITAEDAPYVLGKKSVPRTKVADISQAITNQLWFEQGTVAGIVNFTYDFLADLHYTPAGDLPNPAADWSIKIINYNRPANTFSTPITLLIIPAGAGPSRFTGTHHIVGTAAINVLRGDELYLIAFSSVNGTGGDGQIRVNYLQTGNSFFNYSYKYRHPATFIKGFHPQFLFEQLTAKFTELNYTAEISAYFQKYKNIIFTSGNAIRALNDATIKISFSDFFQFWDSYDSVGLSERLKRITFTRKQDLIDTANFIALPEPAIDSFKTSVAKEFLFNEYQTGYPEIKNEIGVLNGIEEFNDNVLFSLGTTKSPAKLNKISPVKASCYEIEQIRIITLNTTTTDYKNDNNNYVIVVEDIEQPAPTPYHKLDRSLNTGATGLIEADTVFNIFLSPKRMINNNGPFIHSSMFLADDKILSFISSDKNNKMVADGVVEKAPVPLSDMGTRFFYPMLMDAVFPSQDDLLSLMDINPLQLYRFTVDGEVYRGILQKNGSGLANSGSQAFQFLSTADNNIQKLIQYAG